MMRALGRYLRGGGNLILFATGIRDYHWALSPLQQIVNYVASLASRQRDKPYWQRVAVFCYALLKYRENHYFEGMNFVGRLNRPVGQASLRNFVLWQDRMIRNQDLPPGFKFNAVLLVGKDEEVQTDRLFSALCLSDTVNGLSIFWDEAEARRSFAAPLGLTEGEYLRWRDGKGVFDLDMVLPAPAGGPVAAAADRGAADRAAADRATADRDDPRALLAAERDGVPRAFHPSLDPRRQVTHFIKIAHPRGYRLAVSLPEDADGFADASLQAWLPHLERLTARQDSLTVCLLNRFVQGADGLGSLPRGIHAIRQAGLTEQDVLAFAMEAEGFFGCLDIYGLAARTAQRPGIFVPLDAAAPSSADQALRGAAPGQAPRAAPRSVLRPAIEVADTHSPEMFAALRVFWREAEAAGLARHMQVHAGMLPRDNGPASRNTARLEAPVQDRSSDLPDGVGTRDGESQANRSSVGRGTA
ncbi:hypothetical protein ACFOGJ_07945 [Marinibaculum pumilum]|uniref:Uncharacterized protein n=1 Tax=Marinibaculum pumilum TaxID=1766165 RepID=A0ABV7KXM1_9PROT